jgi:hypothetical protein
MMKALQGTIAAAAIGSTAFLGFGANGDAQAAPQQEGLVNVALVDTTVQIPIAIAANVCDLNINVLAGQLALGETACGTEATASAVDSDESGGGNASQNGLVNIYAEDTTIQVPLALAANLCDLNVNALARQLEAGDNNCDAVADSDAS